jgi:hypothetical protein
VNVKNLFTSHIDKKNIFDILLSCIKMNVLFFQWQSWSRSYGSLIYNYPCNQCLSPLKLWVRTPCMARCTRYNIMWYSLSVTCDRLVVFSVYSGFPFFLWLKLKNLDNSTGLIKKKISNLVRMTGFWNNLHQVYPMSND